MCWGQCMNSYKWENYKQEYINWFTYKEIDVLVVKCRARTKGNRKT